MSRKSVHVTYRKSDGMWHVTSGSNGTSSGNYNTQKEAMNAGRKQAMEASAEFCVHGKDGKIRLSTSYGNDPTNSQGSKRKSTNSNRSQQSRSQ
jgi:hypothetical protein